MIADPRPEGELNEAAEVLMEEASVVKERSPWSHLGESWWQRYFSRMYAAHPGAKRSGGNGRKRSRSEIKRVRAQQKESRRINRGV